MEINFDIPKVSVSFSPSTNVAREIRWNLCSFFRICLYAYSWEEWTPFMVWKDKFFMAAQSEAWGSFTSVFFLWLNLQGSTSLTIS